MHANTHLRFGNAVAHVPPPQKRKMCVYVRLRRHNWRFFNSVSGAFLHVCMFDQIQHTMLGSRVSSLLRTCNVSSHMNIRFPFCLNLHPIQELNHIKNCCNKNPMCIFSMQIKLTFCLFDRCFYSKGYIAPAVSMFCACVLAKHIN